MTRQYRIAEALPGWPQPGPSFRARVSLPWRGSCRDRESLQRGGVTGSRQFLSYLIGSGEFPENIMDTLLFTQFMLTNNYQTVTGSCRPSETETMDIRAVVPSGPYMVKFRCDKLLH